MPPIGFFIADREGNGGGRRLALVLGVAALREGDAAAAEVARAQYARGEEEWVCGLLMRDVGRGVMPVLTVDCIGKV